MKIFIDDTLVISHSSSEPLLTVGEGYLRAHYKFGGWSLKQISTGSHPLNHAEYDENKSIIRFSNGKRWLIFKVTEYMGAIKFTLEQKSHDFSRVWIRLPASPNDAVFGGGGWEKGTNLIGEKPMLWVNGSGEYGKSRELEVLGKIFPDTALISKPHPSPFVFNNRLCFLSLDFDGGIEFDFSSMLRYTAKLLGVPRGFTIGEVGHLSNVRSHQNEMMRGRLIPPEWCVSGVIAGAEGGSQELLRRLQQMKLAGVKLSGVYIRDWCGTYDDGLGEYCEWKHSESLYKELPVLLAQLRRRGVRAIAQAKPVLSSGSVQFFEARERGFLISQADETVTTDLGGKIVGHVDLLNPAARNWVKAKLRSEIFDIGFSGVIAGGADSLPTDAVFSNGKTGADIHNRWASLWVDLCKEAAGENVVFADCGGGMTCVATVTANGSGIEWQSGVGLSSAVAEALALGLVGAGSAHCDLGSFFGVIPEKAKAMQTVRWAEYSAFTPVFRTPALKEWSPENDTFILLARMAKLHRLLVPYIQECLELYAERGIPVIRSMWDAFPQMPGYTEIATQFVMGNELVVTPVTDVGVNEVSVLLPEGAWKHLLTGQDYIGGEHIVEAKPGVPTAFYSANGSHADFFGTIAHDLDK